MKTAFGSAALRQPASADTKVTSSDVGQLVFVRTAVVDNVGHVLGNLFQRMYHLANRTRESDAVVAAELESSTTRLEEFLKLLLDYVSPSPLRLQMVSASEVVQSLAQQIADAAGVTPALSEAPDDGMKLLVDPGGLSRSFALMAGQLRSASRGRTPARIAHLGNPDGELVLLVCLAESRREGRSSEAEMQWAVAERLIEIQGGSLRETSGSTGEVTWEVTLPLQT